ncbi:isopeptide-forming domain-containing fimbrial protein [Microbulbifer hainanensis]|uniref:isopeptide-forming domain-containing fimbrial protein n=1 Tax=Microbulbifer hainanensis TaxID=2735675 RepID=UPI001867E367|nr:isopeptide-forming domain-containing fimbrial protein [Microbulbifer hainanensis]
MAGEQNPPTNLVTVQNGYCEFCGYGFVEVQITNPYRRGTNSSDGDQEYETQVVTIAGDQRTQSRRNPDYGSQNPALDFANNGLTISLTDGLERYTGVTPTLPLGGNVSGTSTITVSNMSDLAPGQTVTVRIPIHRSPTNSPESLFNTNPQATATINYSMADSCSDNPGQRENFRNDNWYDPCGGNRCSGSEDPNGYPTDFWRDYSRPANQNSANIDVRQPGIALNKQGWNYDSGQREGTRSDQVFGHNDDDIVWRINIRNTGNAPLQDLRIDDVLSRADVMDENYVCPTAAAADAVAANNGALPVGSSCVATDATTGTVLANWDVDAPFGDNANVGNPYATTMNNALAGSATDAIDISQGGDINLYVVGKIHSNGSCASGRLTNSFEDVQFGCAVQTPPGGIDSNQSETAQLDTYYGLGSGNNALRVERQLTGVTGTGPVGMRGLMTITLRNEGRGTVWFDPSMAWHLRDVLPDEYVVDPSFEPTIESAYSLYGAYPGRVDQLEWVNVQGTIPGSTSDTTSYLNNSKPQFKLTSSTSDTDADQAEESTGLMRHGDVVVIRFAVVMKDADYFDRAADLDVQQEDPSTSLYQRPGELTDPNLNGFSSLDNTLEVQVKTLCDVQGVLQSTMTGNGQNNTFAASDTGTPVEFAPEELDVSIDQPTFILTDDRSQTTPLSVTLTNRGGDEARDFRVFISFGATINVVNDVPPAGFSCAVVPITQTSVDGNGRPMGQPDPYKVWAVNPAPDQVNKMHMLLPTDGTVYQCEPNGASLNAALAAGASATFDFEVNKTTSPAGIAADDLTFRADVVGEIFTLSDFTIAATQVSANTVGVNQVTNGGNRSISAITVNNPTAITNGNPLWFPAPGSAGNIRSDGEVDRGNLYSLDAHWSRGIGFNLKKDQVIAGDTDTGNFGGQPDLGYCNENTGDVSRAPANTFPGQTKSAEYVQIGEECTVRIQTGGWFGFDSRGFNFIGVRDIQVLDQIPNGQSYISSTAPLVTPQIAGATQTPNDPATSPLNEFSPFGWRFSGNQASGYGGAPNEGTYIVDTDQWFTINSTSRLLNKTQNDRAAPNVQASDSANILDSSFKGIFFNNNTGVWETYEFGSYGGGETTGYPKEPIRRVDVVVTEPRIDVVKEICESTDFNASTGTCGAGWTADYNGAVTTSDYIYRLTINGEDLAGGHPRAPVYDLTVEDTLPDLLRIVDLDSDGIDNDGDGVVDEAGGEGVIVGNVMNDGNGTTITFSHTQGVDGTGLRRLEPGASVHLYYRVDPDDRIAPSETLTNTVAVTYYDSLEGSGNDHGNQTVVTPGSGELGGARTYPAPGDTGTEAKASLTFTEPTTEPKTITALSETPLTGSGTQQVKIGEEIEYTLTAELPVAQLRNLTVTDELPPGLVCAEAPTIDLSNDAPWSAAGFKRPDLSDVGDITPSCTDNQVQWTFGNVVLTSPSSDRDPNRFTFQLTFIARVQNSADNNDGTSLINGKPATNATLEWRDESNTDHSLDYGQVAAQVTEPNIVLTKSFAVTSSDADDILTVTVTAENTGTANAYNLQVLDDLSGKKLTFLQASGVAGTDPPDNVDTTTGGANAPIFSWNRANADYTIAPGETKSFTFQVQVDQDVEPQEILDNTIQARWQSLPGQDVALNGGGQIGLDGAIDGMRIGVLPNAGDAINDYESNAVAQTEVPPLQFSKTDLDPSVVPTIGAHKQFQLEIQLPEGVTNDVVATDQLGSPEGYVLSNNTDYDITYEFVGISQINGKAPSEAAFNSFPADNTAGTATWNIGTVATESEDDTAGSAISPVIRITYYARVHNDSATDAGDSRQNGAALAYTNGESGATENLSDNTAAVTVVEPQLTIDKTVTNATNPGNLPVGGDVLEYTVTVQHAGGSSADAFDLNLVDTLPSELQFDSSFTPTAKVGGVDIGGFVATPAGAPTGPLVWGRDNGDNSLDLKQGETLVLVYHAKVTGVFGQPISNSVVLGWTSLDDSSPSDTTYERDDSDCVNGVASGFNDYCAGPVEISINTVDNTGIIKTVVADTDTDTPVGQLRVGDTVTYRLELNLQSGTTPAVTITDQLPGGMVFDSVVSINGDTTAPYSDSANGFTYTANSVPAVDATGAVVWDLGDITSEFGNTNAFVIEYTAKAAADAGISPTTATLTNTAQLNYTGAASVRQDDADITVLQPEIDGLTKTDATWPASHTDVDPANDIMHFTLHACNSGLAPAYDLSVTDTLATQMDETSIGNVQVSVDGIGVLTEGSDYTYTAPTARGGDMVFAISSGIPAGACFDITYEIGFHTDIGGGESWVNTFSVDDYWSLPAESGQQYSPVALPSPYPMGTAATSVTAPQKTLLSGSTAAVGDEVTYRIQVPGSATTSAIYDVAVEDVLDPSLELIDVQETSGNGLAVTDNSSGNDLSFAVDLIPAGQVAIFEVRARVANNASAQAGHNFDNMASYTYAATVGGATESGGTATAPTLTVVEPELGLVKSVANQTSPGNAPDAGDVLRFTLDLTAAGNPENSDAFDLSVVEQMTAGLEFVPGSATFGGAALGDPAISGDGVTTPQQLSWIRANSDLDIPAGNARQLVFDVVVLDSALAASDLSSTSHIEWTSLDEDNSSIYERNGSATPALNDYFIDGTVAQLTAANDSALTKIRLDDSYGSGDAQVRVGDFVEYELRLSLPEGSLPNATLVDTLPQGMVFDRTLSINTDNSAPFTASAPFSHDDVPDPVQAGDPASGSTTLTWNLVNLVNAGDNNTANDEFVIRYRARVLNQDSHPWPANNTPLTNNADFSFDAATGAESRNDGETLDLLQPELALAITSNPATGSTLSPGDSIDYTVTITNNGSAPAYDPVFRDTIPAGLRQSGVSVQSTSVNGVAVANLAPAFDSTTGDAVWNFNAGSTYAINPGQSLVMTYRVLADSNLGSGLNLQNAAFVEVYYSFDDNQLPTLGDATATVDMREDYGPTAPQSVQFNTPNASPLYIENTQTTASIGEPFRYRVTIPESPQTTALHDVRVLMNLGSSAADLVFVEAAKVSGSQAFTPVNTGSGTDLVIEDTANGIDVPAGEQVVIDVTVRLRDTNPPNVDGLTFTNSASYSYNYSNDDAAAGQGAGAGNTTADMTVVEPTALIMDKRGPASVQSGVPGRFTLDVHNTGTGPAWDLNITDILPNPDPGGMCETPPQNFSAQIADGSGNTVSTLTAGTDFNTVFDADNCTLTVTTSGAAAAVPADHRLLFSYDTYLDADTVDGTTLTNVAGVELWHSWDSTLPDARQYTRAAPTDGTPSVDDHEDAFTITAAVPSVSFRKVVENVTSGQSPASVAKPGDRLRYTLTLTNLSAIDVDGIDLTDELGRLNSLPLYQAGTLAVIDAAGGDSSNTDAAGGAQGSGLLDIRNLSLAGNGSLNIVYEVTLAAVIDSGTAVLNQAQVQLPGQLLQDSDDPNINGADDPNTAGDEDPTQVVIDSAPQLVVEKTSQDMTGDADLLMVGDTLRYTLQVENTGDENIVDAVLRDQVPANTTYVANSTTLNGAAVADVGGSTALASGMAINSPGEAQGFVGAAVADAAPVVITFDVTINDVNDGTIISNQGFVNGDGAGSGALDEQPSDDPTTDTPDDPTIDIVGDVPLLIVQKTVAIAVDNLSAGIVDPGDVLRYTITVANMGGVDATDAVLTDQVPANTTYVAGSTTLNGFAVADNGGGSSRLDAGLPISSDDLTPPLPGAGEGVVTSARTATVTFDVSVNAATATGTVISNQGSVSTVELPLTLTDADGNPSNGAQPTDIVVGDAQQLSITKEVAVVGGGAALPGATLEYLVTVTNIGGVPAGYVAITDDLLVAGDGVLTYVADSARLNGQADGITVNGSVINADFAGTFGELQPSDTATLRFQAKLGTNLAIGYRVLNTAETTWNDPASSAQASVAIDVGGTPGIANLSGYLWHDVNFNDQLDPEERLLQNWTVELYFNNTLLETAQSDEKGFFQFDGLVPNAVGGASYELKYTAPNASDSTASLGNASSDFTNGPQQISEIYVGSGSNPQNLNLPLMPNGVVYDSVLRQPISGAVVTMLRASSGQVLPDRCFDDEKQQNQVTQAGGYYKFDINFSDAACPANADYLIQVQVPGEDYLSGESQIIPPQTNVETAGFDVGACLGSNADKVPGTANHCEVQSSEFAPPIDVDARSEATDYYLRLTLDDNRIPGESQLFNNHIALDPQLDGALSITKTASLLNVTRSQLVPYTITFGNTLPVPLTDLRLVDFFPAGFKYVAGSARVDGKAIEPEVNGLQLVWPNLRAEPDQTRTVKLLLVVGSGVGEGKYINRARLFNQLSGQVASGEASATVRVVPDPTFDCTDVIGKVYDDKNMNGYQDAGEGGVPGARVVTATGLHATTDAHGRYHITCAVVPNQDRGSNFVLKLDDRSLPSGYRLTTENPRVQRATRGKMIKFNFGTSLHRVVRLDLAEAVFEPGTTELRPQWNSRTDLLLEKLQEAPSVLRLSYLAENEDPDLVDRRLQAMKVRIADEWARNYGDYELTIETEVFWRRGAPPSKGGLE